MFHDIIIYASVLKPATLNVYTCVYTWVALHRSHDSLCRIGEVLYSDLLCAYIYPSRSLRCISPSWPSSVCVKPSTPIWQLPSLDCNPLGTPLADTYFLVHHKSALLTFQWACSICSRVLTENNRSVFLRMAGQNDQFFEIGCLEFPFQHIKARPIFWGVSSQVSELRLHTSNSFPKLVNELTGENQWAALCE